jgi:hypothetical protein
MDSRDRSRGQIILVPILEALSPLEHKLEVAVNFLYEGSSTKTCLIPTNQELISQGK